MSERRAALVTGGSRGVGRATAVALAEAGLDVAVTYKKDEAAARDAAATIAKRGVTALVLALDIGGTFTDEDAAGSLWDCRVSTTTANYGEAVVAGALRVACRDAQEAALALAAEMNRFSLPALDLARRALLRAGKTPLGAGLASEAELGALTYSLEDSREDIGVVLEKRQPRFGDR